MPSSARNKKRRAACSSNNSSFWNYCIVHGWSALATSSIRPRITLIYRRRTFFLVFGALLPKPSWVLSQDSSLISHGRKRHWSINALVFLLSLSLSLPLAPSLGVAPTLALRGSWSRSSHRSSRGSSRDMHATIERHWSSRSCSATYTEKKGARHDTRFLARNDQFTEFWRFSPPFDSGFKQVLGPQVSTFQRIPLLFQPIETLF